MDYDREATINTYQPGTKVKLWDEGKWYNGYVEKIDDYDYMRVTVEMKFMDRGQVVKLER